MVIKLSPCLQRSNLTLARVAVSLVDGYNLPVRIDNNQGCGVADCPVDLNPNCPAELAGPTDSSGTVVGCKSACVAGLGDPTNNPNCCTGTDDTAATCPSSGVEYYSYFSAYPLASSMLLCGHFLTFSTLCRGQLPQLVRVRVRRVLRHGALDMRL